jgi:TonB family protein
MTIRLIIALVLILVSEGYPQSTPDLTQEEALALLITRVPPQYPPLARQARIQGDVVLRFTIGEDGIPTNVRVYSGHPMLSPSALEAVKRWRFRPYVVDEKPVEADTEITINFKLAASEQERADKRQKDWGRAYEQRTGQRVYRSADEVAPPEVIDAPNAIAPLNHNLQESDLLSSGVEIWCIVDASGSLAQVQVIATSPWVQAAVLQSLRRWKFRPARERGLPVAYLYIDRVHFKLQ